MLTRIEEAMVERLRAGLGHMVREVGSYGGELDEGLAEVIRRFPAAWVTFGGIGSSKPTSTSRQKYLVAGTFVVMVGCSSTRSEPASRHGGPGRDEIGVYRLIQAVRRLLSEQDMGLPIRELQPGRVRTLFNTSLERDAVAVFGCEFHTAWHEEVLRPGLWPTPPAPTDPSADGHPDSIFTGQAGETSQPDPELTSLALNYYQQADAAEPDAQDIIIRRDP